MDNQSRLLVHCIESSTLKLQYTCLLLLWFCVGQAQTIGIRGAGAAHSTTEQVYTGSTRALVVGISDYQNPTITDLQFAASDALAFANYLKDPKKGKMDPKNVVLLLNEHATAANVISTLYKMMEATKEGDQVILYFSGHGDVESNTLTQPGFLLCWDAPSSVYMIGGTFSLVYLQEILSTLSISKKAKILFIADACHSGKLAGSSVNGAQITASNLTKQFANEVKILSCQPDELSLESNKWGNGRGLFSYYLIEGISGAADMNQDQNITLLELDRYLGDKVPSEALPRSQIPMILGNKSLTIAQIPIDEGGMQSGTIIDPVDSNQLLVKNKHSVLIDSFKIQLLQKNYIKPQGHSAWDFLMKLSKINELSDSVTIWKQDLAAALQNECQQAINDYQRSDPVELRKRWTFDNRYADYPIYLDRAIQLLGAGALLDKHLKARLHYFKGLNLRLLGELHKDMESLDSAVVEQNICLSLQPDAAFAYNELGLIARRKKDFTSAVLFFEKAIKISPRWILPLANLCSTYLDLEKPEEAIRYGVAATTGQDSLPLAYYNLGTTYITLKDYKLAISNLSIAATLDSSYSNALFNLSLAYFHSGNYAEAAKHMQHYARLQPLDEEGWFNLGEIFKQQNNREASKINFLKALEINPKSYAANLSLGEYYWDVGNFENAFHQFEKCKSLDSSQTLLHYYFARYYSFKENWANVIESLKNAFQNGFSDYALLKNEPIMQKALEQPSIKALVEQSIKNH